MDGSAAEALVHIVQEISARVASLVQESLNGPRTPNFMTGLSSPNANMPSTVRVSLPQAKSSPSPPTTVTFRNCTEVIVRACWVNYNGNEVAYGKIAPGATYVQPTFKKHPWIFREERTGWLLVVKNKLLSWPEDAASSTMCIERARALDWSQETHRRFPDDFRTIVKLLLLESCTSVRDNDRSTILPKGRRGFRGACDRILHGRRDLRGAGYTETQIRDLPTDVLLRIVELAALLVADIDAAP